MTNWTENGWIPADFEDGAYEHDGVVLTFRELEGDSIGYPHYTGRRVKLFVRFDRLDKLSDQLARRVEYPHDFLDRKRWDEEPDITNQEVERYD